MVAVRELHVNELPAIHMLAHRVGLRIPAVEIAHKINRVRRRGGTMKIDGLGAVLCRIRNHSALAK